MTNDEVKAFWLKHDKKPRVQFEDRVGGRAYWQTCIGPGFYYHNKYRIHPEDLEKFMNTEKKLDLTKPLQRRDGKAARFLGRVDNKSPLAIAVMNNGIEGVALYPEDGKHPHLYEFDLINVPERVEKFVNVYDQDVFRAHSSLHYARLNVDGEFELRGTVKLTYEDGKLVSAEVVK